MADTSKNLITKDAKGFYRIHNGRAKFKTREAAEQALKGFEYLNMGGIRADGPNKRKKVFE